MFLMMVKNLPANAGDSRDLGLSPGLGRPPGEGNGNPLQCSCLGNPMGRGTWWQQSMGSQSWTQLSTYATTLHTTFTCDELELK